MHGSRRGAIENTIRKQCTDLMRAPEPCGFRGAGGAFDPQREPLAHFERLRCSTESSSRSPCRKVYPTWQETRPGAVREFQFPQSTDLHGRVKRSFAAATHVSATCCASVAGQIERARAGGGRPGGAVLAAVLAREVATRGLPSGAERKSNAHCEHFGF
jgi:hypothetical protein